MVVWTYIVVGLCTLVLGFLLWKEVTRAAKHWFSIRIFATIVLIISLGCLVVDVHYDTKVTTHKTYLLLTEGYAKDSVLQFIKAHPATDTLSIATISAKQFSVSDTLHIMGYGVDNAELFLLGTSNIVFHHPPTPNGICFIDWNRKHLAGENLVIQGRYNNTTTSPVKLYLEAFGEHIDSCIIEGNKQQTFQLKTIPKHNGRAVYSIVAIQKNDILESNPVPFEVQAIRPLKILQLASSPSFENKFLKNWLYENSYAIASRIRVSKDKYAQTYLNTPPIPLEKISSKSIEPFDVIITDATELSLLSSNELNTLQLQVLQHNKGLIIQLDSISYPNSFYNKYFNVQSQKNAPFKSPLLQYANTSTRLQSTSEYSYLITPSSIPSLVKDTIGNSYAATTLFGTGKITATTLHNTYAWWLQNKQREYASLWTMLIQKTCKNVFPEDTWVIEPTINYVQQQATISLISDTTPAFMRIKDILIAYKQHPERLFEFNGFFWPNKVGWHKVHTGNSAEYWYVYEKGSWSNLYHQRKIITTQQRSLQHFVVADGIATPPIPLQQVIPKWCFALLFFVALFILWLERKLCYNV